MRNKREELYETEAYSCSAGLPFSCNFALIAVHLSVVSVPANPRARMILVSAKQFAGYIRSVTLAITAAIPRVEVPRVGGGGQ